MSEAGLKNRLAVRKGIRWRLMVAMGAIVAMTVALLTLVQLSSQRAVLNKNFEVHSGFLKEHMFKKMDRTSNQMADHLQHLISTYRLALARQYVRELVRDVDDLKYVILMQGKKPRVAYGANLSGELRKKILGGHAAEFAIKQKKSVRHNLRLDDIDFMETIAPIYVDGEKWGVLRLGFSLEELDLALEKSEAFVAGEINYMVLWAMLTALLFLIVGAIVVYFLAGKWTRPIHELVRFSHKLSGGDFDATPHVSIRTDDEIGVLVASLEEMASSLRESYAQLEGHSHVLEEMVEERTRELAEARDKAVAAMQAKSEFLANMSHEIRTPMNAVIGLTHLTLDRETDKQQRDYLTKTLDASKTLLSIINDILDFSKVEAHKMELDSIDFEIDEVMHNIASVGGVRASEKGLEFLLDFPPGMPRLNGDPLRLGQVLMNLVNNAVKFTEEGQVIVSVRLLDSSEDGHLINFKVNDTGIGLSEEQQSRLFQAFTQADSSITRRFGGTGLGLAISKQLIEVMGGEIGLESSVEGKGSSFYFTVRLKEATESESQTVALPSSLQNMRVLIVDDNPTSKLILTRFLESFGMSVVRAATVKESVKELKASVKDPFGLIVVDWTLAETEGLETLALIRKAVRTKEFPPAILTANYGKAAMDEDAKAAGFSATLLKPVTAASILESILGVFGYLNKGEENLAREQAEAADRAVQFEGVRLLLAEDNPVNQMVAEGLLIRAGISLVVVHNGQEAVDAVRSDSFDGVLLDMQMPVMDGVEAAKAIRSDPAFASLPIIAMTANVLPEDVDRCLEAGMNDHIAKPIEPADLYSKLDKWVAAFRIAESKDQHITEYVDAGEMPSLQGVDFSDGLRRTGGNPSHYFRILNKFTENQADTMKKLRQLLESHDSDGAASLLHSLKSVVGNIGAKALFSATEGLERSLNQGAIPSEGELYAFEEELEQLISSICNWSEEGREKSGEADASEVSSVFDREKTEKVLIRMRQLLEEYNGDAVDHLDELAFVLEGAPIAAKLPHMKKCLDSYDFDAALLLLESIEQVVREVD